ncbi:MAG: polysaccharide biosynthesis/export family protein [Lentisphaerae bacterium]|nr:polysaccharide biosynthesis/export family protein [Lentisphaerota bacterium]
MRRRAGKRVGGTGRGAARAACLLAGLLAAGCATRGPQGQVVERYVPDIAERDVWAWTGVAQPGAPGARRGGTAPAEMLDLDDEVAGLPDAEDSTRPIRRGDRIAIYLRGIPQPEDIVEVVDDFGEITLPLIGTRLVEGLTTAEAERMLVDAYVGEGYYQEGKINVILVAAEEEYFVRGEVKGSGRYRLTGDMTLMQAIATAGGYTDYARTSRIRIHRGDEVQTYDARRIESRAAEDPLIKPGDIIVVPRKIF